MSQRIVDKLNVGDVRQWCYLGTTNKSSWKFCVQWLLGKKIKFAEECCWVAKVIRQKQWHPERKRECGMR